ERAASAPPPEAVDVDTHHALAREAAAKSIVLLKNEGGILPLPTSGRIAVIGELAEHPRYQGGGSSHVNPTALDIPVEEIRTAAAGAEVVYAKGYATDQRQQRQEEMT